MKYRHLLIAIAQTAAMFVAGIAIPILGQFIAIFTPVPLVLLAVRHGMVQAFSALAASCLLIGMLGGWQTAAILFFSFGLMAIGVALGMRHQWKAENVALLGGLLPVLAAVAVTGFYFVRIHKSPVAAIEEFLQSSISEAAKLYADMGFAEMAARISSVSGEFIHHLVRLIPGITVATSIFQAALCYGLIRTILARTGGSSVRPEPSLAGWYAPDVWVWGLIAGLACIVVPDETARYIGWNIAIVYTVIYLTQGVAVVDHYLRKAHIRPFMRSVLHALILALPSLVFVIALGVVDVWADFRKVRGPVKTY